VKPNLLVHAVLAITLAAISGCARVSHQTKERRPFFQAEHELETHGKKTVFDRIVEFDPGELEVDVTPDYQRNAPLRVAVLPFTDLGSANLVVDKIPLTFRTRNERARWAWTDAQRLRRAMVAYLSEREFIVINTIGIDAVLQSRGIDDESKLEKVSPQQIGAWLGADAVVYGEVQNYEAYYLALVSGWQVGMHGTMVSTRNGEVLIRFRGSRYNVNVLPAFSPQDILINSAESFLQLRDVELARSEQEVCREVVLRIPVSEQLRLAIARQALDRASDSSESARPSRLDLIATEPSVRSPVDVIRSQ
jgi:putative lipoprotein DUF799